MKDMKRAIISSALILGSLAVLGWTESQESPYLRLSRIIELFGMIVREINDQYVETVDPEKLVDDAIEHMLSRLDPYTEFYREEYISDLDFLLQGRYVGVGLRLGVIDSMTTVVGITEGTSAERSGIRIGDVLLSIDSVDVVRKELHNVRRYLRGPVGSQIWLRFKRGSDTLTVRVHREEIIVRNVSYAGIYQHVIGVIRLDRFSRRAPEEMRMALDSLRALTTLRGLILDLRDNPGGLLDAAVNIAEMFLHPGDTIVITKSRNGTNQHVYVTRSMPYVDTTLPIVVLVNGKSASASEILAAALQDNDRAVIVGDTTVGKGLVQTVVSLPYNAALKLSTARYYSPLGRSLQHTKQWCPQCVIHRSLEGEQARSYTTLRYQRAIRSAMGIVPDTVLACVDHDSIPMAIGRTLIWRFATDFASRFRKEPSIPSHHQLVSEFIRSIDKAQPHYSSTLNRVQELLTHVQHEGWGQRVVQQFEKTANLLQTERIRIAMDNSRMLGAVLEREIKSRFLNDRRILAMNMPIDPAIRIAGELLSSSSYRRYLVSTRDTER